MHSLSLPVKLLLAIVLGGLIGLERESAPKKAALKEQGDGWGLRTYSLISLLGALAGLMYLYNNTAVFLSIIIIFMAMLIVYYAVGSWMIKSMGITTELGALFSFLIGYFVTSETLPIQLTIAVTIVLELILSLKEKSRSFILGIKRTEVDAFIGFAIIALVILPFLPNQGFYLTDIQSLQTLVETHQVNLGFFSGLELINPFRMWFIVALVTGIEILGYILMKSIGAKNGVIAASIVGGFISSTSVTQSLAVKSRGVSHINELVAAAVFANTASFIKLFLLLAPLNGQWVLFATPILILITSTSALIATSFILKDSSKMAVIDQNEPQPSKDPEENKIFSIGSAIRFSLILVLVGLITKSALELFGQTGFMLSSVIASLSGIDAVVVNLAEMAGKVITPESALFTLLCVNATNLLSKSGYAFIQAKKDFSVKLFFSLITVIIVSFIGYIVLI